MRPLIYTLSLFALAFCFVVLTHSCRRSTDDQGPVKDSTYLAMTYTLDTTYPSGKDTITKEVFTYDAQKRIIQVHMFQYLRGIRGSDGYKITFYSYNGNETLPYRLIEAVDFRRGSLT